MNSQVFRQLFSYLIVGGIATIVEWVCFYIFSYQAHIHYLLATTLAFAAVQSIVSGSYDKQSMWNVNTESEYHEEVQHEEACKR